MKPEKLKTCRNLKKKVFKFQMWMHFSFLFFLCLPKFCHIRNGTQKFKSEISFEIQSIQDTKTTNISSWLSVICSVFTLALNNNDWSKSNLIYNLFLALLMFMSNSQSGLRSAFEHILFWNFVVDDQFQRGRNARVALLKMHYPSMIQCI